MTLLELADHERDLILAGLFELRITGAALCRSGSAHVLSR
jgi:hypothetical protein